MKNHKNNQIMAILTTIPIIFGLVVNIPLVIAIAILTFFVPVSTYYFGLLLMARAKSKKEEEERKKITFTGY